VDGQAEPGVVRIKGAVSLVDARSGLAYPACELAVRQAVGQAERFGIAFVGVTRSHHFGAAALHVEPVAERGLVGIALSNSPAAMPAWGGRTAIFGTNPIGVAFPRPGHDPLVIDMSLSKVARGRILIAAEEGREIPSDWALDREGRPTTDPKAALAGTMLAAGDAKGVMLALIVELLVCALTGGRFGFEADAFFAEDGNRPEIGQAFIVIDPGALVGREVYGERIETLTAAMLADEGVRLPGGSRRQRREQANREGVTIPDALFAQLHRLADSAGGLPPEAASG
jgi:(2R)-3-sulfolactate dehydrogenase (NADP+)